MEKLYLITGNEGKFDEASAACAAHGIQLDRLKVPVVEEQSDDISYISEQKARYAYDQVKKLGTAASSFAVIVNDAGWKFPGLGGFPGAYMAYANEWFDEQAWERLLSGVKDDRVVLSEAVTFYDGSDVRTFTSDLEGRFVYEPLGKGGAPSDKFVILGDTGLTIAEQIDHSNAPNFYTSAWTDFAGWYAANAAA